MGGLIMYYTILLKEFLLAFASTVGFSILFNSPRKSLLLGGLTGGIGWIIFSVFKDYSSIFAAFLASTAIGLLGEVFARIQKRPVTVFVIPGIVPIVPGFGLYLTMVHLINNMYYLAAQTGTEAVFTAGAISIGIIVVSSSSRLLKSLRRKKV